MPANGSRRVRQCRGFLASLGRAALLFRARAEWLKLDIGDLEGKITGTSLGLEWNFHRHVGLGFEANGFQIELRDTGDSPYLVDYNQGGLLLYVTGAF